MKADFSDVKAEEIWANRSKRGMEQIFGMQQKYRFIDRKNYQESNYK